MAAEGSKVKNKIAGAQLESIVAFVDAHPTSGSRETNKCALRSFLRLGDLLLLDRSREQLPKLLDHLSNNVDLIQRAIAFSKAWLTARSRLGNGITDCPKLPDAYGKAFDCFAVGVLRQLTLDDDEAPLIVSEFERLNKEAGTELKAANSIGKTTTILQPPA
ncbi:hypothetical protein [Noviherbaspirillum pedocola]|uniref:Uncharacterized protein n=1 Tax=Noviherbaspirillum pedocola TaxID=2801341 RepID=A0A934SWL2_9BURK|nr:hypothetical protein [Noviherbaspirillum pedocola]MBK4733178.1 hypothetical protein [Noviherbaspirillum pedocola]